ncbi:MAG TPA: hypothetical protein VFO33_06205, partial [Casimicrobiaceae bacterium]|nr:hypothetical protein [Casimicrobiaceae bacterium]
TVLKRSDLQELDPAAVTAVLDSAGLQQRGGGGANAQHRHRDARGHGKQQQGRRPGGHGNAPQSHGGQRSFGNAGPRPQQGGRGPGGPGGKPGFRPHAKGPRPYGQGHGQQGHGQQGQGYGGKPAHAGGNGFSRPHGDHPGRPQRPPRPKGNFDEVQPMSNANASPFATTRLSLPHGHGAPRGNDPSGGHPRFRSGPRAKGPGGPPQHRMGRRPQKPRGEVNGNVAPRNETPPPIDDES